MKDTGRENRIWLFIVMGIVVGGGLFVFRMNLIIDPYGVFGSQLSPNGPNANIQFAKIEFLQKWHNRYDSYMFGSSRIALANPALIERYLPGTSFYNCWMPACSAEDMVELLRLMVAEKWTVKTLFVQFDVDGACCWTKRESVFNSHYKLIGISPAKFFFENMSSFHLGNIIDKLRQDSSKNRSKNDFANTGCSYPFVLQDCVMRSNHDKFIQENKRLNTNRIHRTMRMQTDSNLIAIRKLKELCKQRQIELLLVVTPHNYNSMNQFNLHDYIGILASLSEICPYWDFSGYNSITTDNHYYYDEAHYVPAISRMMIAKIFGDTSIRVPLDFGEYVTHENVNVFLEQRKRQIKIYESAHMDWIRNDTSHERRKPEETK